MTVIGVDQFGNTYHNLGKHPRKVLLERLNATRADLMYQDTEDRPKHVGYVIKGLWITLYNLTPWERDA